MIADAIGQALIGWLAADFVSGAFHWWQDRLASSRWPRIGPWLIEPSRVHHREPLAFLAGSFGWRTGYTIALALAVGAALLPLIGPSIGLAAAVIGGAVSTEVHYLAHRPKAAGPVVRVLQEVGVIQSPKHHAGHHGPPHLRRYCVLTDWLNPVLDALRVWERLERAIGDREWAA